MAGDTDCPVHLSRVMEVILGWVLTRALEAVAELDKTESSEDGGPMSGLLRCGFGDPSPILWWSTFDISVRVRSLDILWDASLSTEVQVTNILR